MCWSSPFQNIIPGVGVGVVVGESCSSQGTELCKACFMPGMCRQGEARDGKEPFQPYILRRACISSSKCWKIKEEIPEQKWLDRGFFRTLPQQQCDIKERESCLTAVFEDSGPALLAVTQSFVELGTSVECRSSKAMPSICLDPFTSKTQFIKHRS